MGLIVELRSRAKHVVGPVLGICTAAYFAYHIVEGDRGLIAWWTLRQHVADARTELNQITARRKALEHRVKLLTPDSLDPDMLDERARVMLNYSDPGDIIIFPKAADHPAGPPKDATPPSP